MTHALGFDDSTEAKSCKTCEELTKYGKPYCTSCFLEQAPYVSVVVQRIADRESEVASNDIVPNSNVGWELIQELKIQQAIHYHKLRRGFLVPNPLFQKYVQHFIRLGLCKIRIDDRKQVILHATSSLDNFQRSNGSRVDFPTLDPDTYKTSEKSDLREKAIPRRPPASSHLQKEEGMPTPTNIRFCRTCEGPIPDDVAWRAIYCSGRCRTRMYQRRRTYQGIGTDRLHSIRTGKLWEAGACSPFRNEPWFCAAMLEHPDRTRTSQQEERKNFTKEVCQSTFTFLKALLEEMKPPSNSYDCATYRWKGKEKQIDQLQDLVARWTKHFKDLDKDA